MWVKQCHKPTMTGNGRHITYKNGDDWGICIADEYVAQKPHHNGIS